MHCGKTCMEGFQTLKERGGYLQTASRSGSDMRGSSPMALQTPVEQFLDFGLQFKELRVVHIYLMTHK